MSAVPRKRETGLPSARKIRRSCSNELYRTIKRMRVWIPEEKIKEAELLYSRQVMLNIQWIFANYSNRKAQADWWEEHVSEEISKLWDVDRVKLCEAFREAYGG